MKFKNQLGTRESILLRDLHKEFEPTSVNIWRHWYEAPNERMPVYLAHKLVKNGGQVGEYWGASSNVIVH